jgi:hypothetical protein
MRRRRRGRGRRWEEIIIIIIIIILKVIIKDCSTTMRSEPAFQLLKYFNVFTKLYMNLIPFKVISSTVLSSIMQLVMHAGRPCEFIWWERHWRIPQQDFELTCGNEFLKICSISRVILRWNENENMAVGRIYIYIYFLDFGCSLKYEYEILAILTD